MNKKLITGISPILLLIFFGLFSSCSRQDDGPGEKIIAEEVTIRNSEIFSYSLGDFGIEEGAYIQKEPENSEISEVIRKDAVGEIIYRYKAQQNFKGKDHVELWTGRGSDGASHNTNTAIIKITFTITE